MSQKYILSLTFQKLVHVKEKKSCLDPKKSDDMQQVINTTILTQLESLGKRLDSIEQNVTSQGLSKVKSQKSKRKAASPPVTLPPSHQDPQISRFEYLT